MKPPIDLGKNTSQGHKLSLPTELPVALLFMAAGVTGILLVFAKSPTVALALAISLLFCIFASQNASLIKFALFALIPFPIALFGSEQSFNLCAADMLALMLLGALPINIVRTRRFTLGWTGFPLAMFILIQFTSAAMFWEGMSTLTTIIRMLIFTFVAVAIFASTQTTPSTVKRCFHSYLIGVNILTLCSLFAFARGGVHGAEYTLGINKNSLGPIFGSGVAVVLAFVLFGVKNLRTRFWLIATGVGATVGLMLSLSRGAWVATGTGVLFLLLATRNIRAFVLMAVVLVPTVYMVWSHLPDDVIEYASNVSAKSYTINARQGTINECMAKFRSSPVFGVGVGLRKLVEPHNVLILTLAETGIIGLFSFVCLIGSGFYSFFRAARLTKSVPEARQLVIIGASVFLISIVHGMMDVYWRRGVGIMGWASVGMSIYLAHYVTQKVKKPAISGDST
jgi:O-antigen ligase